MRLPPDLPMPGSDEYVEALKAGMMPSRATRSITRQFLRYVREQYDAAALEPPSPTHRDDGTNRSTKFAIPAYICAAAAIEAFVNELFFSDFGRSLFDGAPFWDLPEDEQRVWERMPPPTKLILLPYLFVNKRMKKGESPYQDAVTLFSLRNGLLHYKFRIYEPEYEKAAATLANKGVVFPQTVSGTAWVDRVSTVAGIRWAYNAALATIKALVELLPENNPLAKAWASSYDDLEEISA